MHWQDIVISVGQYIFALALLPSIFSADKPALSSSVLTSVIIIVFGVVYGTLGMWSSVVASAVLAVGWSVLAFQKYTQKRKSGARE